MISNTEANLISIGSVTVMTIIAGFSLPVSLGFIGVTTAGAAYLTIREGRKNKIDK